MDVGIEGRKGLLPTCCLNPPSIGRWHSSITSSLTPWNSSWEIDLAHFPFDLRRRECRSSSVLVRDWYNDVTLRGGPVRSGRSDWTTRPRQDGLRPIGEDQRDVAHRLRLPLHKKSQASAKPSVRNSSRSNWQHLVQVHSNYQPQIADSKKWHRTGKILLSPIFVLAPHP
jgi:hypothetical protein